MYIHYGKNIEVEHHDIVEDFLDSLGEYTILPIDVEGMIVVKHSDGYAVAELRSDLVYLLDELPEDGDYQALKADIFGQMHGREPQKMKSLFCKLFESAFREARMLIHADSLDEEDRKHYEACKLKARETVLEENRADKKEAKERGFFFDEFRDGEDYIDERSADIAAGKLEQKIAARLLARKGWDEAALNSLAKRSDDLLGAELDMLHEGFNWYKF